jgi:uncharacterized YccA/Bax inhibitor family protein
MLQSSNPILSNDDTFNQYYGAMAGGRSDVTTMTGVVNKTAILVLLALVAGGGGYALFASMPSILWIGAIAAFVICLGMGFILRGKPQASPYLAPVYAIVEGVFLGAFTALADDIVAARGLTVVGGVGVQAFVITGSAVVSMLLLYRAGIIKPTRRFHAVIGTLTGAIMLAYLASFVLSFFGISMPLLSFGSAVQSQGIMGFLGLGINLFILVVASLFLIIDFKLVEDHVSAESPKYMEWYCGFALLVTLAWIYFESVKLVLRIAVLFGGRD